MVEIILGRWQRSRDDRKVAGVEWRKRSLEMER